MNYIEEELLRQTAAFAALLGGGANRRDDAQMRGVDCDGEWVAESGGDGALRLSPTAELLKQNGAGAMTEWNQALRRRSNQSFRQAVSVLGFTETELKAAMTAEPPMGEAGPAQEWAGQIKTTENGFAAGRQNNNEQGAVRQVEMTVQDGSTPPDPNKSGDFREAIFVADHGVSAGELSRTFQRDARRYDGGYPLY